MCYLRGKMSYLIQKLEFCGDDLAGHVKFWNDKKWS
jgi:hypothetical protein